MAGAHLRVLEWSANAMLWTSGILLSVYPELARASWKLFALMLVGQLFWAAAALHIRKWSLFTSSVFFVGLNIYGIYVRW